MKRFEPVKHYESEIKAWEDVIITSIFAAIGVNLFVSGVAIKLGQKYSLFMIIIGLVIFGGTAVLFLYNKLKALETNEVINGFFAYDREKRDIIRVTGYEIEERMWLHMLSVYSDNKELADTWKANKIGEIEFSKDDGYRIQQKPSESDRIVAELIEYCILQLVSSHLVDYYSSFAEGELKSLTREDVPEILKSNRFLNWFSEPTGDEDAFREILFSDLPLQEKAKKLADASSKKPFSRFEIALPRDGLLLKKDNSIIIDHPLFSVAISSVYNGSNANIPAGFENRYLGLEDSLGRYGYYYFSITLSAKFKTRALFSKNRKKYSLWIDSLAERLTDFASSSAFFERIGWNTANTVIECMNRFSADTDTP